MSPYVCSLKVDRPQAMPGGGVYNLVRFPYEAGEESYDPHGMHEPADPLGYAVQDWSRDDRSGLIWPAVDGWATLTALIYWEAGDYTELRDRFVRDPLGLAGGSDSTATEHRPPSPGAQFFHKTHEMFVHPGTLVGLLAAHNAPKNVRITLAEFKLAIHPS
ncbi:MULTISPECIES: hypothetical protein [unclassified Streptomyces]|uniref:hypothetical protein n=1 Tax=unclassified Streptomyces TaxID=2593676 RepID=UPI002E176FEB|nr:MULTISPECIES: hypothetical protein [unclassified Streptomyces]